MKKKERKKREKGTKEKTFSSFLLGQLALHLRHRLQDLFSSELQRMAFFCFLSRCQKSDVQMQRREKNAAFLLQVFSLSFISSPFSAFRAPFPLLRTAAQVLDGHNFFPTWQIKRERAREKSARERERKKQRRPGQQKDPSARFQAA
jgi:hypothetical protein